MEEWNLPQLEEIDISLTGSDWLYQWGLSVADVNLTDNYISRYRRQQTEEQS